MRIFSAACIATLVLAACGPAPGPAATPAPTPVAATPSPTPDAKARVAEFYKGKTVTVIVGYSPGGGYDLYARQLATHIGKHIPGNPTVIVENMAGAGSLKSANHLFTAAPKDGTVFGTFGRGLPANELTGQPEAQFKSTQFNWIGSLNDEVSVCVVRRDSGIAKLDDAKTKPVKIGATGPDDDTGFFPRLVNSMLGTKFDLVTGYKGGSDVNLAIERGEVAGRCGFSWSSLVATKPQWLKDNFVNILVQMSLNKHPDIAKEVPLITELAPGAEERQIFEVVFSRQTMGRPFAAPPGIPAERVAALREAFIATTKDGAFVEDMKKAKLELNPKSGEEIQKIVEKIFQTPTALREKLKALLPKE